MAIHNRKFKLTLLGLVLQGIGLMAHATCGTQTGTDYTISTSITGSQTFCDLPSTATNFTITSGSGLSTDSNFTNYGVRLLSGNLVFNTFSNSGTLSATYPLVLNSPVQNIQNNTGALITGTSTVIQTSSTVSSFINNGSITGTSFFSDAIQNPGHIFYFENNGTITSYDSSSFRWGRSGINNNGGQLDQVVNNGFIGSDTFGIKNAGTIGSLTNNVNGTITGGVSGNTTGYTSPVGIFNDGGTITSIVNMGTISATGTNGTHAIYNSGNGAEITTITNWGTLTGANGYTAINNNDGLSNARIVTLNNAQNGLTYSGVLPTYYNIIITNSGYGTLNGTGQSAGSTMFGVSSLSTLRAGTFQNVLTGGFSPSGGLSNSGASTGTVTGSQGGYNWTLTYDGANWDLSLLLAGPSAADTQASLQATATRLQSIYTLQNASMVNGLTYDCTVFDKNGFCLSAGGRNTRVNVNGVDSSNGLLIGAYRVNPNTRVGAWVDQNLSGNTATGVALNNASPMFGAYGVWNENASGEGFETKLAVGYGNRDMTVTRDVIGTSETGSGTTKLNTQGIAATLSYNIPVDAQWVASPYFGVRHTKVRANGYTEAASSTVTAPLTYAALTQEASTASAGVKFTGRVTPEAGVFASAGLEQDFSSRAGTYSATGVAGLTDIVFNPDVKKTRTTAAVGAWYDVEKNQRIGFNAIYRTEPFRTVNTLSAMLTYTVGL